MKAIRGRQPLIPSLWSLEPESSRAELYQDPLLIQRHPVSTDALTHHRDKPRSSDADSKSASSPSKDGRLQRIDRSRDSLGYAEPFETLLSQESPSHCQANCPIDHGGPASDQSDLSGITIRPLPSQQGEAKPGQPQTASDLNEIQLSKSNQETLAVCEGLLKEEAAGIDTGGATWTSTALLDLSQTLRLHSNPTASRIIYLDFDGHTTTGTAWNSGSMGASFYSPAYDLDGNPGNFSTTELTRIQQIWQRVTSDFAPFDVDVTTQAPPDEWLVRSSSTDANFGIRVVMTNYGPSAGSAGGIAIVDSFMAATDTPAFVYNLSVTGVSEAISHEVGHTLGLSHDGTATSSYYTGHGSGETSWGPIMGAPYNVSVTTWDNGSYYGSNNSTSTANYGKGSDDLAIITTRNGFGFCADLIGSSIASASSLAVQSGVVAQFGTIEVRTDRDVYAFQMLDNGSLDLTFNPYCYRAYVDLDGAWGGSSQSVIAPVSDFYSYTSWPENGGSIDLSASLYSYTGELLASSNPTGLAASLAISSLAAGTYYLALDGVGYGEPMMSSPSGYTDYCSIGNYWISGSILNAIDSSGPESPGSGTPLSKPVLTISDISQREGTGSSGTVFQIRVNLSMPSTTDITVNFSSTDGSAVATGSSSDYTPVSGTLKIAAGLTSGVISLGINADNLVEADEQLFINLSDALGADIADNQAVVNILNDDTLTKKRGQVKLLGEASSEIESYAPFLAVDPITGEQVNVALQITSVVGSAVSLDELADSCSPVSTELWSIDSADLSGLTSQSCLGLDASAPVCWLASGSDLLYGSDVLTSSNQVVI